jgi:hypothetical protein
MSDVDSAPRPQLIGNRPTSEAQMIPLVATAGPAGVRHACHGLRIKEESESNAVAGGDARSGEAVQQARGGRP